MVDVGGVVSVTAGPIRAAADGFEDGAEGGCARTPYKSCGHYSVTAGLNLSRGRKLDAKGNADLSGAKRSRVAPTFPASRGIVFLAPLSLSLSLSLSLPRTRIVHAEQKYPARVQLFFFFFLSFFRHHPFLSFPFLFLFLSFLPSLPFQFGLQVLRIRCNFLLPFEMFDNIFVGSTAVFPNRPGPVDHKKKRHLRYDGET